MRFLLALSLALAVSLPARAADWPTFLGPTRDGASSEKGLITPWPKEGLKKVWECELGIGFAHRAQDRHRHRKIVAAVVELRRSAVGLEPAVGHAAGRALEKSRGVRRRRDCLTVSRRTAAEKVPIRGSQKGTPK